MATKRLTREEAEHLKQQGYLVEEGQEVLVSEPPKPSALGVGARAAAASALPTLAGGVGFAGGMAAGAALAPATGGLSVAIPLVLGAAGALGASKATAAGQEAVLPESVKQQLAEDYQARPVVSTIGGLTTLPLGGFNPGKLSQIGAGLSGIGKVVARPAVNLPLSIAEKQAALNMAGGGVIGAAQEAVMQPLEGREFSPAHIALNAAIGGTFIQPNPIGRALKFKGIPERVVDDPAKLSRTVGQHVEPEPEVELRRPTVNFTETQLEAIRRSTGLAASKEPESRLVNIETGEEIPDRYKLTKKAKTSASAIQKALEKETPVVSRETDPDLLNILVKQGKLVEKPVEVETPRTPSFTSPLGEEVGAGLKERGMSTGLTEQYVNTLADEVLGQQNIKVTQDSNLVDNEGAPVRGTALLPNNVREVLINPKLGTLDTVPHEGLHYFRTELELRAKAGDKEAQRLLGKWDEVSAPGLSEYNARRQAAGLKPVDAHEFAVSENGLEFVKQQFNLNKESGLQKWWNDTKALFRERYSKNATVEDLRRAINYRFVNEQTKGLFVGGAAERNQGDDYSRYVEVQNKMRQLIKEGKSGTDEFIKLWQESENLKNKNGGMPPIEQRNQPDSSLSQDYHTKSLKQQDDYIAKNKELRDNGLAVFNKLDNKVSEIIESGPDQWTGQQLVRNVIEGIDSRPRQVEWVRQHLYNGDDGAMLADMVVIKNYNKYLDGLHNLSKQHVQTFNTLENKNVERNQPAGEGLTPQPYTEEQIKRGQAFQDNLQGRSLERIANVQDEIGISDSAELMQEANQAAVHLGNLNRNQGADEGLVTRAEKLLRNPEASKLPFSKSGVANGNQLLGSLKNQLAPAEWDMLQQAGIEKHLEGRIISKDEALRWVKENGPKVEVHSYGMEGKVSEARREYDKMTHEWYDLLPSKMRTVIEVIKRSDQDYDSAWKTYAPPEYQQYKEQTRKYVELRNKTLNEPEDTAPRATSAYETVSAFDTREPMPEWTTSKEGKNVQRVDVVIPTKGDNNTNWRERDASVKWMPDNLHENLPNTLGWAMIQYKTGPKGEKIAFIAEAQSRWGQELRDLKTSPDFAKYRGEGEPWEEVSAGARVNYIQKVNKLNHPLLRDYNRLILKAAIEQAKKEGATHIVVSDAETAMMTEGHDLHSTQNIRSYNTEQQAKERAAQMKADGQNSVIRQEGNKWILQSLPEQEPGMRLNYDTVLPRIASELTGSKGERVSLGEHKNAFEGNLDLAATGAGGNVRTRPSNRIRQNLIFRNPDGTPKTDVTGMMFPLKEVSDRLERGDQFTLFNKYQGAEERLARTEPSAKSFLPGLASALDKVEQRVSAPIAQAGRNWASRRDQYVGKMQVALADLEQLKDSVADSAMKKMRMVFREEVDTPPMMTPEEQQAAQVLRDYYTWNVEERRRNGQLIEGREAGKNPYYVPDTMNEQARYTLLETPNSPEARHLKKVWADYVMRESEGKLKREEVVRNINNYVDAMGSRDSHYTSINFGAARKAQGYGMPEVMRETSAKKALISYGRRAANDMAFFKEIESQRDIATALKLRDPVTGNLPPEVEGAPALHTTQEVKNMMAWITGNVNENSIRHPFITSAARLTNNLLLGAPTGLRDLAQVPVFNVPYMNKFSDLANFAKGILNFRNESRNALEYAARQPQIDKIVFSEIADSPNRLLSAIQKAATLARKAQGREFLENLSRDISFSIGKELARGNVLGAKAGHAQSKKFLERFGTLIDGDITMMEGPALENALNQMAKNVVDATQGTYGPAGLPNFTAEGQLAPFLALTKWSIEKSNTIFKDVVKPFYTGENRIPLLTYTLGSVLTGAGIQQLNEALSNKRGSDPNLEEALAKGDAEAISLQLATLMQLGTYGGIVGDGMKILADAYKGKTPRNPLSFPLYSSAMNSADMIADAVGAIQEGEDPVDILYRLSLDLMANNVQNARVALNRLEGGETERKEAFRDVRVFEELEGERGTEIPKVNRYRGMKAKEFKREKDIGKAAQMIPGLVSKARSEAESLEELRMKLRSLKQNNYQTFPNPKTQPEAFQKYYQFLVKTQGAEEAQKRLADYLIQNRVNRVKSQLVPAL